MTRGTSRMVVKTRSGFSEIRVERRAMPRAEVRAPALPVIVMPVDPSLADRIAAQLRGRIAFPAEFYRGAAE